MEWINLPRRIVVVKYDPTWKLEFEAEAKRIALALGDLVVDLHHIGSTAIPGIFAKPIIDVLLEVDHIDELDERTSDMEELGYEAKGEFGIPGRRYFRKNDVSGERTHQVHAFEVESLEIKRHLAFRDYMIAHPEVAQMYSELKLRLARKYPNDIEGYMDGKDSFIKKHESRAIAWRNSQKSN
jgi:GrpB-like predicted nucleotidyltransferase (UPF0157 family)